MESQKMGFSAIFISIVFFMVIAFIMYYPLLSEYNLTNFYFEKFYQFALKFKPLSTPYKNKFVLALIVTGSVMLYRPKKDDSVKIYNALIYYSLGIVMLMWSDYILGPYESSYYVSMTPYIFGFVLMVNGAVKFFQIMNFKDLSKDDPFNEENETFLQMEKKIDTPYSVNIPYEYKYKGKKRNGWINFINLFRALMIIGTPGSGKSFAIIEEIIEQLIRKYFTLVIYDFKYDTLSKIAYNYHRQFKEEIENDDNKKEQLPEFYFICFDNVQKSHRCNPIDPFLMESQTDAADAATTIMKNLNREWIKRNDFFSRSAISFVTGLIWYLKNVSERTGKNVCTLPHVIILSTVNIDTLLPILLDDLEVRNLIIPFKDALDRKAEAQLAGQTASAQISLSMLANKELFYVMSGNDFQLDINNPKKPKIICLQNNPKRSEIYSAPIGLYVTQIMKVINEPGKRPLAMVLDELPTIFLMGLRKIIDTGRSNKIATILGIQGISQMVADYGKELSDVVFENCANIFCGSAKEDTAKKVSAIFGKTHQQKNTKTISKNDTTTNVSSQMMDLLPQSKIASMSTGNFAGIVADDFHNPIKQKLCYGLLKPNIDGKKKQGKYDLPLIRDFRKENHQEIVEQNLRIMRSLNFYELLKKLDLNSTDYIYFYNQYLEKFTLNYFEKPFQRAQFKKIFKDLKIFNHLQYIEDHVNKGKSTDRDFQKFFNGLMEQMLIESEMQKVLEENFLQIIDDIDQLVRKEYVDATGEEVKKDIFGKIAMDIPKEKEESEETIAANFERAQKSDESIDELKRKIKEGKLSDENVTEFEKNAILEHSTFPVEEQ